MLSSCFSTDVVEVEIPNEEFIVVQSTLKKDSIFTGVLFTKTLSLNESYDIENAELTDVIAYILIDETLTIPLHYSKNGIYLPLYPHRIKGGSLYELFAEYKGTQIYSRTFVPDNIQVIDAELSVDGYIKLKVKANDNYVFGALWETYDSFKIISAEDFHSIVPEEVGDGNYINVRSEDIPEEYLDNYLNARVYAFDKFYRNYFQSKGNNKSDSLFSNVTSPNWNINSTSSNVIGLFIGMTKSELINVSN
jgi:hypothetical protein